MVAVREGHVFRGSPAPAPTPTTGFSTKSSNNSPVVNMWIGCSCLSLAFLRHMWWNDSSCIWKHADNCASQAHSGADSMIGPKSQRYLSLKKKKKTSHETHTAVKISVWPQLNDFYLGNLGSALLCSSVVQVLLCASLGKCPRIGDMEEKNEGQLVFQCRHWLFFFFVVCHHGDSSQNFDWLILCQMHWVTFGY